MNHEQFFDKLGGENDAFTDCLRGKSADEIIDAPYINSLESGKANHSAAKASIAAETINGAVNCGDWVIVRPDDAYGCLVGQVTAVNKVGSEEHDTDNPSYVVHVNFVALEYSESAKADFLEAFDGYFPDAVNFDALPLDDVIMAPESLISLAGLEFSEIKKLSADYKAARAFGDRVLAEKSNSLKQQLIARVEQNYDEFEKETLTFGKRQIVEMAGRIAAMQYACDYMKLEREYSDDELRFYLQFTFPLDIVADASLF